MLNEQACVLGTKRSCIRELFEYGKSRAAVVGAENIFDFSIGNPSIPAPAEVEETIRKLLSDTDSLTLHGYTSAVGDPVGLISGINIITVPADPKMSELLADCVRGMGSKCVVGTIASGDQFVAGKAKKDEIRSKFEVIAAEMEGGAIGQVCYINKVPFAILRSISDGEGGAMDYTTFAEKAADIGIQVVVEFINRF